MVILVPAALPTSVGPYLALMGGGFLIGIVGHLYRSRSLILAGILIVGVVAVVFGVGVAKIS